MTLEEYQKTVIEKVQKLELEIKETIKKFEEENKVILVLTEEGIRKDYNGWSFLILQNSNEIPTQTESK